MSTAQSETHQLSDCRVAMIGKFGGMSQRSAQQIVRDHGGTPVERGREDVDLIVIGADELPVDDQDDVLGEHLRQAAAGGRVEIITETQLWQRLGMVDAESEVHRLHTPAMLADLLEVPIAIIRRWHRRGLIIPVREVQRLPYFDFQEVATARRLAQLLAAGASPGQIEKKLAELARFVPEVERPLAQLSVIVEGKHFLLRQGEGLLEPGGQLRFDFDAFGGAQIAAGESAEVPIPVDILSIEQWRDALDEPSTPEEMLALAAQLEDEGHLGAATEIYRATLLAFGPNAEVNFLLAELLYRLGDVTAARERYYATIELDEDYVEARANLGCVLVETGQSDLAVQAFEGALRYHDEYPDAHYHLARTLDDLGRTEQAHFHWARFVELSPSGPWAEEARRRLVVGQIQR